MNSKLSAISHQAAENFIRLVEDEETEKRILEAWSAAVVEAQENETKPKFRLALAVTLDLDADSMETALTFGVRYKTSCNDKIPDPSQPELPIEEEDPPQVRARYAPQDRD